MPTTPYARKYMRQMFLNPDIMVLSSRPNMMCGFDVKFRMGGFFHEITIPPRPTPVVVPDYVPAEWEKVS